MAMLLRNDGSGTIDPHRRRPVFNTTQNLLRLILAVLIVFSGTAVLCGMTIEEPGSEPERNRQIAVIRRDASITTVMITEKYTGYGGSVAWFIPLPPDAQLLSVRGNEPEALGFVDYLNSRTGPLVDTGDPESCRMIEPAETLSGDLALKVTETEYRLFSTVDPEQLRQWSRDHHLQMDYSSLRHLEALEPEWRILAVLNHTNGRPVPSDQWIPPVTIRYRSDRFVYASAIVHSGVGYGSGITLYSVGRTTVRSSAPSNRPIRSRTSLNPHPKVEKQIESLIHSRITGFFDGIAMLWSGPVEHDRYYDSYPRLDILADLDEQATFAVTKLEGRSPGHWRPIELVEDSEPKDFRMCFRVNRHTKALSFGMIATPVLYHRADLGSSFAVDIDLQISGYPDERRMKCVFGLWTSLNATDFDKQTMVGADLLLSRGVFGYLGASFSLGGLNPDLTYALQYVGIKGALRPWFLRFESWSGFSWSVGLLQFAYYWNLDTSEDMWSLGLVSVSVGLSI